ncbi:hypothetical protein ACGFMM_12020 [Streptomyces sp. NPDC048604]|uniref:hypothetical protein n=1 Tax=Streptomyces sp. NPDC048604 TaxID=3365578 RepID=UPI00371F7A2B
MRNALRTALSTAVVAGVALTPALTAGAAFAADAPKPAAPAPAVPATPDHDVPLVNGLVAKVHQVEPGLYTARIFKGDEDLMVSLRAGTAPGAKAQDTRVVQGVEITLKGNGDISAVVVDDGSEDGGELGKLFKRQDLGHGYKGLVYVKDGGIFTAKILQGEKEVGTLKVDQKKTRDEADFGGEIRVSLSWDGSLRATWIGDEGDGKPTPAAGTPLTQPKVTGCTVRQEFASVFPNWTVTLVNDKAKGPRAVLITDKGAVAGTADRQHPVDGRYGLKITGADTYTPKFGQRSEGGDAPYAYVAFPKLPEKCTEQTTPAPAAHGKQTTVVPKGGVAAGAELGQQGGDHAFLVASGAAATAAAAVLGFVVVRRRAAANV